MEVVPDGYVLTSEVNNDGISIDSEDKTIELTNTITLSMIIKKEWADGQNHEADSVTVNIHRSTNPSDAPIVTTISADTQTTSTTKNTTTTTTVKTVPSTTTSTSMSTTTSVITTTITTTTTNGGGGDVKTGTVSAGETLYIKDDMSDVLVDSIVLEIINMNLYTQNWVKVSSTTNEWFGDFYIKNYGSLESTNPNSSNFEVAMENSKIIISNFKGSINRITFDNGGDVKLNYTINYASSNTYSLRRSASFYSSRANDALVGEAEWTGNTTSITLKFTDNWEKLFTNLPAYDEEGNPYYYWVEEDEKSAAGFEVSYKYDDGDNDTDFCINAINPGDNPTATIRNKVVNTSVTMPSTGGKGTTWYYITGTVILLSSSAAYYLIKRRWKHAAK